MAADQGHAGGQYNLEEFYYNWIGVNKTFVDAVKWYLMAADQGHAGGQCDVADCYYSSIGVSEDYTEANGIAWLRNNVILLVNAV